VGVTLQHLTDVQVASELNVSVALVRKWRRKHVGPPFTRLSRAVRYPEQGLREWLVARTTANRGEVA